jgi:hypothetical protein
VASKGKGQPLVYIDKASVDDLVEVSRRMKALGNGKQLSRMLNDELRQAAKPIVDAQERAVLGIKTKGGASEFGRRNAKLTKTGKVRKGTDAGLRATIAKNLEVDIKKSRSGAGVRVKLRKRTPDDVARLAELMNEGEWRHPTRKGRGWRQSRAKDPGGWVTQTVEPKGWFTETAQPYLPKVRADIRGVLRAWLRKV